MTLDDDDENPSSMRKKDSKKIAAKLFDTTCRRENCHPDFVHSDNGEPMKGITLCAFYYQLGIIPSFSRPGVSDDNRILNHSSKQQNIMPATRNVFMTPDEQKVLNKFYFYATTLLAYSGLTATSALKLCYVLIIQNFYL